MMDPWLTALMLTLVGLAGDRDVILDRNDESGMFGIWVGDDLVGAGETEVDAMADAIAQLSQPPIVKLGGVH